MTEPASGGTAAPNPPAPNSPVTPPAPPAPAAAPPATPTVDPPTWLPDRLNEARATERRKLLQEFGVTDSAELKARLDKAKAIEDAQLTEQQKTEKLLKELTPQAERATHLEALFGSLVESRFTSLPEATQAAIDAKAAGNAEKRWELIQFLESTGGLAPAVPVPQPPRSPAQTSPAAAPPPPASSQPETAFTKWDALAKRGDSLGASLYYQMNAMAIEQSRPAQGQ